MAAKAAEARGARSSRRGLRSRMNEICEPTLTGQKMTARSADSRTKNSLRSRGSDATKVNGEQRKRIAESEQKKVGDEVHDDDGRYDSEGW